MKTLTEINLKSVFDSIYEKGLTLSPNLLRKITDSSTSTYDLLNLLCIYINASRLVENHEDLKAICDISIKIETLKKRNQQLSEKYHQAMTELLSLKEVELKLRRLKTESELNELTLKSEIKELQQQIEFLEIVK